MRGQLAGRELDITAKGINVLVIDRSQLKRFLRNHMSCGPKNAGRGVGRWIERSCHLCRGLQLEGGGCRGISVITCK